MTVELYRKPDVISDELITTLGVALQAAIANSVGETYITATHVDVIIRDAGPLDINTPDLRITVRHAYRNYEYNAAEKQLVECAEQYVPPCVGSEPRPIRAELIFDLHSGYARPICGLPRSAPR